MISDYLDGIGAEAEGRDKGLENLDVCDESIYHCKPFEGFYRDLIGIMDVLQHLFDFNLENSDFEE